MAAATVAWVPVAILIFPGNEPAVIFVTFLVAFFATTINTLLGVRSIEDDALVEHLAANKIHLEIEKKQEGILAVVLNKITASPSKFIATMLIGNNIALVVYGLFMGDLLMNSFA